MKDSHFYGHGLPNKKLGNLKGSLIVIEGTDHVGRSTQIEQLKPWLEVQGYGVVSTRWTRSALLYETIAEAKAGNRLNATTFALLYAADFADRLENEIIPALQAGLVVLADRYMYNAFARNKLMGADPAWTRSLFGFALIPDLVLYLKVDLASLVPRALEGKGMDYWESGMHLAYGPDLFESFCNYQRRLIREFNALAKEFNFTTIDARRSREVIQKRLREHIGGFLHRRGGGTLKPQPIERTVVEETTPISTGNGLADDELTVSSALADLDSIKVQAAK
ncbi:MAG: dTMP kinase [Candidatus Binataceae bacterium]